MNLVNTILVIAIIIDAFVIMYLILRKKNKGKTSKSTFNIFNSIYNFLIRVPIINKEIILIKKRLYDNNLWDERVLRYKAVFYYLLSWIAAIVSFIFVLVYFKKDYFEIFILAIFCYYLKGLFLELLIGDDTKLLEGLSEFNDDLIQDFHLQKDVDKAVEQAQEESGSILIVNHIENMKPALEDSDELEEYVNGSSNEFLKLTAINCALTKEYGDNKIRDNESTFTANIRYFNSLIKMEIFKRKQIRFWLKGLAIFSLIPLLFFTPYDRLFLNRMTFLKPFYQSSWGFLIKIFLIISILVIFYIIRSYSRVDYKEIKSKKYYWEERLLKIGVIRFMVDRMRPKPNTRRFFYYRNLINKSQTHVRMEWLMIHRILAAILSFIIALLLVFTVHRINYQSYISDSSMSIFGNDVITVGGQQVDALKLENSISLKLKNLKSSRTEAIKEELQKSGVQDQDTINTLTIKISDKIDKLNNEYIKWYEVAACFLIAFLMSWSPIIYLKLKSKSNSYNMESELMIFETIIIILMFYDDTTIEKILEYWSKFSHIFKAQIDDALFNIQKGPEALEDVIEGYRLPNNNEEVLSELIDKVDFKPFKSLVKNLMKVEDIKASEAFSNLSEYRNELIREREEENKRNVSKRISRCVSLSIIPWILVPILYITVPMMIVQNSSMNDFNKTIVNQLKNNPNNQ